MPAPLYDETAASDVTEMSRYVSGNCGNKLVVVSSSSPDERHDMLSTKLGVSADGGFLTRVEERAALELLPVDVDRDDNKRLLALAGGWVDMVVLAEMSNCDGS